MTDNKQVAAHVSNHNLSFERLERMAVAIAKSGLFAAKTPEAALTLMLVADAEGVHPAKAMLEYDIIQGRPSLKSMAMLARFQAAGGTVEWLESTDERVTGKFSHPQGGSLTVTWDGERLKKAGLTSKEMHNKYPQQMKRARCISEAIRAIYPGITSLYTPEEVRGFSEPEKDITPPRAAIDAEVYMATALTDEEIDEHYKAINGAMTGDALKMAFQSAWKHAAKANDATSQKFFKLTYEQRKLETEAVVI